MRTKLLHWMNVLIGAVLGMMGYGLSGCAEKYGVPMTDFVISGQVKNEDKEALKDIQIVIKRGWADGAGTTYWTPDVDTLYTDVSGTFFRYYSDDLPVENHRVIANDTAGVYASDSVDSTLPYAGGKGTLTVDLVLKKK